jgi:drug/metabolite transporter (DMT)-like permease
MLRSWHVAGSLEDVTTSAAPGRGLVAVAGAVVSFSISSALVKWAATPGAVIAFWRMVGAVLAWWLVLVVLRLATGRPFPSRQTWRAVVPAGLFFGANISLFFTAVTKTSIAHAEFITSLSPLLLVPAGAVIFGEQPRWRALGWGLVSLVGIAIVLAFGPPSGNATVGGDLLMLVVLCTWVGYLVSARRARATVEVVDFMSTVMPVGMLTASPIAFVLAGDDLWPLSDKAWVSAALLTVLTGMLAHGLIAIAQRAVDVGVIATMQVAQPALAVGWAYLIVDEEIRLAQVPGMVLVLVGLVAFTLATRRRLPPPVDDAPAILVDHAG